MDRSGEAVCNGVILGPQAVLTTATCMTSNTDITHIQIGNVPSLLNRKLQVVRGRIKYKTFYKGRSCDPLDCIYIGMFHCLMIDEKLTP